MRISWSRVMLTSPDRLVHLLKKLLPGVLKSITRFRKPETTSGYCSSPSSTSGTLMLSSTAGSPRWTHRYFSVMNRRKYSRRMTACSRAVQGG